MCSTPPSTGRSLLGYTKIGSGCAGSGGPPIRRRGRWRASASSSRVRRRASVRRWRSRSPNSAPRCTCSAATPRRSSTPRASSAARCRAPSSSTRSATSRDLDAVRAWTDDLSGRIDALHGLVHNAGVMPKERTETPQGHETAIGVPRARPAPDDRPAAAAAAQRRRRHRSSSCRPAGCTPRRSTPTTWSRRRGSTTASGPTRAPSACRWCSPTRGRQRLAGTDVRVESMHPGWAATPGVADRLPTFQKLTRPLLRDTADGADTAVWLVATRPDVAAAALLARPRAAADDVRLATRPRTPTRSHGSWTRSRR